MGLKPHARAAAGTDRVHASRDKKSRTAVPLVGVLYVESVPRLGLNREEAARLVGVSPSKFDEMVRDRRMPPPKRIDRRLVWDGRQLTKAFDELPGGDDHDDNPWDESTLIKGAR